MFLMLAGGKNWSKCHMWTGVEVNKIDSVGLNPQWTHGKRVISGLGGGGGVAMANLPRPSGQEWNRHRRNKNFARWQKPKPKNWTLVFAISSSATFFLLMSAIFPVGAGGKIFYLSIGTIRILNAVLSLKSRIASERVSLRGEKKEKKMLRYKSGSAHMLGRCVTEPELKSPPK